MKPAWDKLMRDYKESKTALIADVDCTTKAGEKLCGAHGIEGYPTIRHGDPTDLQEYSGEHDFKALKAFADLNLKPQCGFKHPELCDEESKSQISMLSAMDETGLTGLIADVDAIVAEERTKAEAEMEKLSEKIQIIEDGLKETITKLETKRFNMAKGIRLDKFGVKYVKWKDPREDEGDGDGDGDGEEGDGDGDGEEAEEGDGDGDGEEEGDGDGDGPGPDGADELSEEENEKAAKEMDAKDGEDL